MPEPIQQAIRELQAGKPIVVLDDASRENEADLVLAARLVTPQAINFMISQGRGLVCLALTPDRAAALQLPLMAPENSSKFKTNFTVSIEAREGIGTGISADDRAKTILTAVNPGCRPEDLARPGHVFPLIANRHGVLGRAGHTEAAVDLMRLAGLEPAGVICEILNQDGQTARGAELAQFATSHWLTTISMADIIAYRLSHETLVERLAETTLPTNYGRFNLRLYRDTVTNQEHLALTMGTITSGGSSLCRVHSSCVTGDIFGSQRCDCQPQLHDAMALIQRAGRGVILYLDQEGRGIGLAKKIAAYGLQDRGADTVEANQQLGHEPDERHYWAAASMLKDLGLTAVELLTNNPQKVSELTAAGITVTRTPLQIKETPDNARYLRTKKDKLGHWF